MSPKKSPAKSATPKPPVTPTAKQAAILSESAGKLRAELLRIEKTARHEADPRDAVSQLARALGAALDDATAAAPV